MAASVEKARKLQEELGKAEAKLASPGSEVPSFVNFDKAFKVSCDKWLLIFDAISLHVAMTKLMFTSFTKC